jgi:putative ABC transport system ATP-binding protein
MPADCPIVVSAVSHHYGEGPLRRQVLFDVSFEVRRGEIVILTGPSGSGKTTLLTLIGALRSTQQGSLRVLGRELRDAGERELVEVRKSIGYVFQAHNLLDALTAVQNVAMSLALHRELSPAERRARASEVLGEVGLGDRADHRPAELSGGQKQRVAIARALAGRPRIVLADEPTASLDRQSGREVVERIQDLARRQGSTVLLVTHDNRILDIADRIVHLEDGRLASFSDAVLASTRHMLGMLAQNNRKGELARHLRELPVEQFATLLEQVTGEFQKFLELLHMSNHEAFESMLEQVLEAFTFKVGEILRADRSTLFLVDRERGELWSKVAENEGGRPLEIRVPIGAGIAGHVAATGETLNVTDAYAEPRFNPEVDRRTGYRTRSVLCVPITDTAGRTFAVAQLLNKADGQAFGPEDERRFREFAGSIGVILESWWVMNEREAGVDSPRVLG